MSEQSTGDSRAATIAEQMPAIQSLAALAGMLGSLPGAYFTLHQVYPNRLDVQTDTIADFEVWREALQVPSSAVELHCYKGGSWLEAHASFHGTELELTSHGLLVDPDDVKTTPAEDAERRAAALVEQRHQLLDAAVPPLAFAEPTPASAEAFAVRTLADAQGGAV